MVEIPKQLQNPGFRFVLIRPMSKMPFEQNWQNSGYKFDDPKLLAHLKDGGNYGVIGGFGNLIIIDFDDEKFQEKILPLLPQTFTVKTGSGKLHKYFICDESPKSFKILTEKKESLSDVQGIGKQVVAPGSTHPNGTKYCVVDENEIARIDYAELKALFFPFMSKEQTQIPEITIRNGKNETVNQIKGKITVPDVLSEYFSVNTLRNPTECPFHSSRKGKCFSFTSEVWHCFHCEKSGDVFTLIMEKEKCSFKKALSILGERVGVQVITKTDQEYMENDVFKPYLLADDIIKDYKFITINDNLDMYYYDETEGIYKPGAENIILFETKNRYYEISKHQFAEVLHHIQALTLVHRREIGEDKFKVHLQNGIFDFKEMNMIPFNPKHISLIKSPIIYDRDADCPIFKKFVVEILNEEDIKVVQELFGYCLWRDYALVQKAFICVGEGKNGKSTLLSVLKAMLGVDNVCSVSLQELEDRFATSYFYNKMANIHSDVPSEALQNTGKFKMLTGGDSLMAEMKNKMGFTFVNYAKMVFACNTLPAVKDKTIAFFRRWIILNFPNSFEEGGNADPFLLEKMASPEEISGIFNWSIEGLKRLLQQRRVSTKVTPEMMGELYQRMADSLYAFVTDCIEVQQEDSISKTCFYEAYISYCKEKGYPIKSKDLVGKNLARYIPVSEAYIGRERVWNGVKINYEKLEKAKKGVVGVAEKGVVGVAEVPQEMKVEDKPQQVVFFHNNATALPPTTVNNLTSEILYGDGKKVLPVAELYALFQDFLVAQADKEPMDYLDLEAAFSKLFYSKYNKEPSEDDFSAFNQAFERMKVEGLVFEPRTDLYKVV